ncbi:hypothetical protein NWP96_07330 [Mycoplasmopsis cynos]|nr:hypothetical protein [Mycoplasmopsis cynos]
MKPLVYKEKAEFKEVMKNETTFLLSVLERGFGNTLGVALRRVILSNITTLAPFCVRIDGAEHLIYNCKRYRWRCSFNYYEFKKSSFYI